MPSCAFFFRQLAILLILMAPLYMPAQSVVFEEEPAIRRWRESIAEANKHPARLIDVWRIQIAATVDRRQMEAARSAFNRRYGWFNLNTTYSEPFYKLQVGAYYHKRNAEAVLWQLKRDYPGAYLVRDKVKLGELTD